ncbi:MAG: twin-arginine translocase subunit TatC [Luteolibacter sp.]
MFILKKLFQLRDHANVDSEKPFLDHLEDLRTTITRMVITLAISMIACFSFQARLMDILRAPAEKVGRLHAEGLIPEKDKVAKAVDVDQWEQAKKIERATPTLAPADLAALYSATKDADMPFHVRTVSLLRAALALPEGEKREAFLNSIPPPPQGSAYPGTDMQKQLRALITTKASPEIDPKGGAMSTLKPTESFMLSMKLAFFAGIVVSFPFLLYFLLQFILPGLHGHEKKVLWPALGIGFGLFLFGVVFAYVLVLPKALLFFAEWGKDMGISNDWRIGEYISFTTQFTLLFGASFELPVVVMVCVKLGLLGYETMKKTRRYAIVAIFIIAAVLTPTPDMMTQTLMAAPMIILYEACIWLAWWDEKKKAKMEEAEARERMENLLLNAEQQPDPYATEEGEDEGIVPQVRPAVHTETAEEPSEIAGDHDEPPVEHDPDLLPPPTTQEEPRKE